ncbi:MAG: hypothetical protein M3Q98_11770 [Actinomycetota bacterium]|nr:hypothetical protein [Actinomycetota bacterium]
MAGSTALNHDGFQGFAADEIHVTLPEGAMRPTLGGVSFHWSTELTSRDVHLSRVPRRTRPARSVVDFASWCGSDRYGRAIVIAAFQQGLVGIGGMKDALSRRGPIKRRALIVESVFDARGGIQSLPERDFDDIRRSIGLPPPSRQRKVRGKNGHYYLDVAWETWGIAVEIHGLPHQGVLRWDADIFRANEIVIAGPRLLAFTSYAVRHEQSVVADQLIRMFRSVGWNALVRTGSFAA